MLWFVVVIKRIGTKMVHVCEGAVRYLMSAENTHITLASVLHFHVVLALFIKFWVLDLLLCVYFEMQA